MDTSTLAIGTTVNYGRNYALTGKIIGHADITNKVLIETSRGDLVWRSSDKVVVA